MPVTVVCPKCGKHLRFPDNLAGKRVKCPACSWEIKSAQPAPPEVLTPIRLPQRLEETPMAFPIANPPPIFLPLPAEPPPLPVRREVKPCPFCGEEVLDVAKKCKHCGETIDVALRAEQETARAAERQAAPTFINTVTAAASATAIVQQRQTSGCGCILLLLLVLSTLVYFTFVRTDDTATTPSPPAVSKPQPP